MDIENNEELHKKALEQPTQVVYNNTAISKINNFSQGVVDL